MLRIAGYALLGIWLAGVLAFSFLEHMYFRNHETWVEYVTWIEYVKILFWPFSLGWFIAEMLWAYWVSK